MIRYKEKYIENDDYKDEDDATFIPNLILHEFEMLLFINVASVKEIGLEKSIAEVTKYMRKCSVYRRNQQQM